MNIIYYHYYYHYYLYTAMTVYTYYIHVQINLSCHPGLLVPPQQLLFGLTLTVLCSLSCAHGPEDTDGHDEMQMAQGTAVGELRQWLSWCKTCTDIISDHQRSSKFRKYQKHRANIRRISKVAWSWRHLTESFELAVGSCYSAVNDSELHSLARNADMLWLILAVLLSHYLTRVRSYISHWVLAYFQSLQRKQLRIQIPLEPPINASISKESKMMQIDAATQCLFCRVL